MERIGSDIERELRRFGGAADLGKLLERWPDAVGEGIAANAQPARVQRDGTLVVHTSSSAWAFELTQLAPSIAERLGDALSGPLKFVPGPLAEATAVSPDEATREAVQPSPAEVADAARAAAAIEDEKLRKLVARAAAASLARVRSDRSF